MAGKPGRSGGARPGAGRPPKEPEILAVAGTYSDPLKFLLAVVNDSSTDAKLRVDADKAMLPYIHQRKGEGGKKDAQQDAAVKAAGRFGTPTPPRLVAAGGQKV